MLQPCNGRQADTEGTRTEAPTLRWTAERLLDEGTSWGGGNPAGTSISLANFYIVQEGTPTATINAALAQGSSYREWRSRSARGPARP